MKIVIWTLILILILIEANGDSVDAKDALGGFCRIENHFLCNMQEGTGACF